MMLRSSSTPILGSLLHSESPTTTTTTNTTHHHHHSISCHFSGDPTPPPSAVRRTLSDGNLHSLLPDAHFSTSRRPNPILETIPSFSIYQSAGFEQDPDEKYPENDGPVAASAAGIGTEFSFSDERLDVGLAENPGRKAAGATSPLFMARGLGIDQLGSCLLSGGGGGGGGGGDYGGGDQSDLEKYYKKMIEEEPGSAVLMSNYAQFLYQTKGDLQRAEEYYSRAILAEPGDGEILSQYAKLVWELHGDEERASSYFENAVQAAPQDSYVLAAYAGFLWEVEDDDCAGGVGDGQSQDYGYLHHGALASAIS